MADSKEYYNEDITRRRFLGTAGTVVAGAAALTPPASAQDDPKALKDPKVVTEHVTFRSGAETINGFLARPRAEGKYPAVLVIPGIFGVSEYMRETAARLAQNGFVALDVNLFARTPEAANIQEIGQLRPIVDRMPDAQILNDCQAALDYLKGRSFVKAQGIGVVGFCMGGKYALLLAARSKDVAAAVPYYGPLIQGGPTPNRPAAPIDVVKKIRVPVQGHYGATDMGILVADVEQFEKLLRQNGQPVEMHVYQLAGHAFHDYSRPSYHRDAATVAWRRTLEFFKKHVTGSSSG